MGKSKQQPEPHYMLMTESHSTKIDTFEQYGDIYDVMKDDNTGEIYLSIYDTEYKMQVNLHFNNNTKAYDEFIKMALESVYEAY